MRCTTGIVFVSSSKTPRGRVHATRWAVATALAFLVAGCTFTADSPDAGEGDAGQADAGMPPDCDALDEDECEATDGCQRAVGRVQEAFCANDRTEPVYVGCMQRPDGCNDAITCVVARSGEHVYFPNTCVPPYLERCSSDSDC